jgi:putative phosphotransacetylase
MFQEELVRRVVEEVLRALSPGSGALGEMRENIAVPINISNRHIHVCKEHLEILFGKGAELTRLRDLMQPGEFASRETLTLVGATGVIQGVRVLGPVRKYTQVEISRTDSFQLGIDSLQVRDSGLHEGTAGVTLVGPCGAVALERGVILAQRHIHMHSDDGRKYGFKDGDWARVRVGGARGLVFDRVLVRVRDTYAFEMHIDIDEANACLLKSGDEGWIMR